jgi:GNAT superfamily N-acetyltransferase
VGLAWARIDPAEPDRAYLYQMWVAPPFRRLGVGRMLLAAATAWARASNARSLALSVTCGSVPAERLYTAAGFTPAGAPEPIRPGSPLLVQPMQLELRAT